MKKIELAELKQIELQLLCDFHDICEDIGFEYSLAYGTLLGAVRHNGFIPWDDDIDVCMNRLDYEQFLNYCSQHETKFDLITYKNCNWYHYPFAKICAKGTVIEEDNTFHGGKMGVYIDIFPIDSLGRTETEAIKNYQRLEIARDLLTAANWKKFFRSKTHSLMYEPVRLIFFLISRLTPPKLLIQKLEHFVHTIDADTSQYCGNIFSTYRENEVIEKIVYNSFVDTYFEGKKFRCIEQQEKYLSHLYGDYMKLPPKDKQRTHHMFQAWWI